MKRKVSGRTKRGLGRITFREISSLSLKDFHNKKNKILVIRSTGGLGDILMHRMMFEDFKRVMPEAELTFACPKKYHEVAEDHPFIDHLVDCEGVSKYEFALYYNTTSICNRHELARAPFSEKNRSDIWANHCGVLLSNHNMHLNVKDEYIKKGKYLLRKISNNFDGPIVILSPVSAMTVKNLLPDQLQAVVNHLKSKNCFVVGLHNKEINFPIPQLNYLSIKEWMGVVAASDYVVSVDTSTFHLAGGLGKPLTGIFTFADGKVYGKYYNFVLVQKHRDDGNWDCGPCYHWVKCPKTKKIPKPCLTELTPESICNGIDKMFEKFPINSLNISDGRS